MIQRGPDPRRHWSNQTRVRQEWMSYLVPGHRLWHEESEDNHGKNWNWRVKISINKLSPLLAFSTREIIFLVSRPKAYHMTLANDETSIILTVSHYVDRLVMEVQQGHETLLPCHIWRPVSSQHILIELQIRGNIVEFDEVRLEVILFTWGKDIWWLGMKLWDPEAARTAVGVPQWQMLPGLLIVTVFAAWICCHSGSWLPTIIFLQITWRKELGHPLNRRQWRKWCEDWSGQDGRAFVFTHCSPEVDSNGNFWT